MTANTLYSDFIDRADVSGNIKNNRDNLAYISALAGGIVRYDLYSEIQDGGLYCFIGNNENSHKINFLNENFTLSFRQNVEHGDGGMILNNNTFSNYGADTFINNAYLGFNVTIGVYRNLSTNNNFNAIIGCSNIPGSGGNQGLLLLNQTTSLAFNNGSNTTVIGTSNVGNIAMTIQSGVSKLYLGEKVSSVGIAGTTSFTNTITIGADGNSQFRDRSTYRFAYIFRNALSEDKMNKFLYLIRYIQGIKNRQ